MSSSPEFVVRATHAEVVSLASPGPELRSGTWTRLGDGAVLGDEVAEAAMHALAETTRAAARAQGYAVGWTQGLRDAEEQARIEAEQTAARVASQEATRSDEHRRAVAALMRAAQELQDVAGEVCAAVESRTVEIALQLAEAVLGREVLTAEEPGPDAVRRALQLLPSGVPATVRLHPADQATVPAEDLALAGTTIVADPTLERGDAVAETPDVVVDATVAGAMARVREVLLP